MRFVSSLLVTSVVSSLAVAACGTARRSAFDEESPRTSTGPTDPKNPGSGGGGGGGGGGFGDGGIGDTTTDPDRDPLDCEEAAKARTYVGCDYWPTVTGNVVPDAFDFAVIVSNVSATAASVHVTGPNGVDQTVSVAPGSLEKIYLPWVRELKGAGLKGAGDPAVPFDASVFAPKGAYHVVSSVPVVVYQFNPLEYAGKGGPPGKDWSGCAELGDKGSGCFSYSNDASLLLPSTAWTGTYRVTGIYGWSSGGVPGIVEDQDTLGTYATITASQDGTVVKLQLGTKAKVLGGERIAAGEAGSMIEIALDAGDVAQVVTEKGKNFDMSGTLVTSSKPVQIISGTQCISIPSDKPACDHVEESVLPAEALGRQYVVTTPTRPKGTPGLHVVRLVGNRDGTTLTYTPSKPEGCPDTLNAGQVADCSGTVSTDFVVTGSAEFSVVTFMPGASVYEANSTKSKGDPSQTIFGSTEQFRKSYLFLAPDDYDVSYAVIVGPSTADPVLDGEALTGYQALSDGFGVWRVKLGVGNKGAHELKASAPVGLQVMGYGAYTSYQFPGGLNIKIISPPPPVTK